MPGLGSAAEVYLRTVELTWSSACPEPDQWRRPLSLDVASHMHQLQWSDRRTSSGCKAYEWTLGAGASLGKIRSMHHNVELQDKPEIPMSIAQV